MGIGKKMTKGMIGGGVNIAHKSKMSNAAKNQMSFPGGMPGPGAYGKKEGMPKIVGKGMMKYLAGEPVGMKKGMPAYKEEKGVPEYGKKKGMPEYGDHMGPEKALVGKQKNLPEELKKKIEAAPGKYGKTKMKSKGPKKEERNADGTIMSPRQKRLAKEKADEKKKTSDLINKKFKGGKLDLSKSSGKKSMSDGEKIKASKAKKEAAGNKKKSEGQADLKKAKEMKFISRGSGEDSGIATREERRKAIRDARSKKRAGRREARKARKKTVIKQKI
jgi:hypothetical protein